MRKIDGLFDADAELALLGNVIIDRSAIETAAAIVTGTDFADRDLGHLFDSIVNLHRAGIPTDDIVLLIPQLRQMQLPDAVTNSLFISGLFDRGVKFNERYYSIRIRELSHRRRLVAIADRLGAQALDTSVPLSEVERKARSAIDSIGSSRPAALVSIGDAAAAVLDELRREQPVGGAKFGLGPLDSMIGQMRAGELWVVAARPGNGKTSLAMQTAIANASEGRRVLVVSLEMTSAELATRELCGESGIDSRQVRMRSLTDDDLAALQDACQSLQGLPLDIWAPPSSDVAGVRATALLASARGDLGLVIVDYLSRMTGSQRTVWERIAEHSAALKSLAKEVNAPVLVLSQFNRDAEGERPSLAMLRYGGSIEQDADGVVALHPADPQATSQDGDRFEILVLKNRHGAIGTINVVFDRVATRFQSPIRTFAEFDNFNHHSMESSR